MSHKRVEVHCLCLLLLEHVEGLREEVPVWGGHEDAHGLEDCEELLLSQDVAALRDLVHPVQQKGQFHLYVIFEALAHHRLGQGLSLLRDLRCHAHSVLIVCINSLLFAERQLNEHYV